MTHAASERPAVRLVRPAGSEPAVVAALVRIRGELVADGFEVTLTEALPNTSSAEAMSNANKDQDNATIGLFLKPDGQSAELWVVDRVTHKTVVRQVDTQTESAQELASVLAVRAVELLRASLLESLVSQQKGKPVDGGKAERAQASLPVERKAEAWATRPLQQQRQQQSQQQSRPLVGFQLGLGVVWHPQQLAPALAPTGRMDWFIHPRVHPRLAFVGLGTRPTLRNPSGEASVSQGYGLSEVVVRPWPQAKLSPQLSLGCGVWRYAIEGRATWPYEGTSFARWAVAVDAGLGLSLSLSRNLALVAELHATAALPQPEVRLAGTTVATLGRPATTSSLTLQVSL